MTPETTETDHAHYLAVAERVVGTVKDPADFWDQYTQVNNITPGVLRPATNRSKLGGVVLDALMGGAGLLGGSQHFWAINETNVAGIEQRLDLLQVFCSVLLDEIPAMYKSPEVTLVSDLRVSVKFTLMHRLQLTLSRFIGAPRLPEKLQWEIADRIRRIFYPAGVHSISVSEVENAVVQTYCIKLLPTVHPPQQVWPWDAAANYMQTLNREPIIPTDDMSNAL